ncbi:MAG: NfeD family protein, partial [bacterium]
QTLTIAYIDERAISAGALISLSCRKIGMAPASTMGAATPVTINPLNREMQPASEKVISYFRKEMKATAEKNGRSTLIAEAMVDPDVVIEGLTEKGKLLTLTTSEAIQHKVADFEITGGLKGVLQKFDLEQADLVKAKPNWAEIFLRMISGSLISSLLLTIGLLALFLEFRTPTWGVAGTIGIICLALFFWGHVVLNLVGWEEVILLAVGAILLLLEVFVIPGFGLAGILGIIALIAGFSLSMVGKYPTTGEIWGAVSQIFLAFFIVFLAIILSFKSVAKSAAMQRLVLHSRAGHSSEMPHESPGADEGEVRPTKDMEAGFGLSGPGDQYLVRHGTALTNLRPSGKGVFGNERLNVVTEGDFIEKGSPVTIIRIEGANIIVRKVKQEGEGS